MLIGLCLPRQTLASMWLSFSLLSYVMTSVSKPKAICDLKAHLPNPLAKLKIYINNVCVNNKASDKGNEYQMYTKVNIGTKAFGEDFSQLVEDLKGVHPGVTVYVSALQKPNPAQKSWLMYLHQSFDLSLFMSF